MLVYVSICLYMNVYALCLDCFVPFQAGLFPFTTADYGSHPLTSGKGVPCDRIESFHMAVGNLRCFDARRTDEEKGIRFDWFNRDNCFIKGARKVPPYTDLFWAMFFKVASRIGPLKAIVSQVSLPHSACICMYMHVSVCI